MRSGADPGQFDDPKALQRSSHGYLPITRRQDTFVPCCHMATYTGIEHLSVALHGHVLSVTLNRPESLNSLTEEMCATLADVLEQAAVDPQVRVVRLGGAGRGFSSGAGIGAEDQAAQKNSPKIDGLLAEANRAVRAITLLPKPVVAVVAGPAAGVDVSLALACDVVLASESVLPARVHQDWFDARRRGVGSGRRRDRTDPGYADGAPGRTDSGRGSVPVRPGQRAVPSRRTPERGGRGYRTGWRLGSRRAAQDQRRRSTPRH